MLIKILRKIQVFKKLILFIKSLFKPKKVIGLSTDPKIKLSNLKVLNPKVNAFYGLDKRTDVFEVTAYNERKQIVTVTDIAGHELIMSKTLFEYFFFEIMEFTPKKYVSDKA